MCLFDRENVYAVTCPNKTHIYSTFIKRNSCFKFIIFRKKKLERYENLLTGNGLQPGYEAMLIFDIEVVKIKPRKS
jgi:hypothetical protein